MAIVALVFQHIARAGGVNIDIPKLVNAIQRFRVKNGHAIIHPKGDGAGVFAKRHIIIQKFKMHPFVAHPRP